ncbi:MAG: hypothetical protein DYH08_06175 [Actinobacteria bacterium ATB1]|nr:hypothetical protein [Actinobacteria bacterium ATB1]
MSAKDTPPTTDFGAPIVAGPFEKMDEAKTWIAESEQTGLDIYWESSVWYVHGPMESAGEAPPLTTYGA